jgi:hypothetical protein
MHVVGLSGPALQGGAKLEHKLRGKATQLAFIAHLIFISLT